MTFEEVKKIFEGVKGAAFVGLDTESPVKLKGGKKNPFQGRVTKVVEGSNVTIAFGEESLYENSVRRKIEKEGKDQADFELKPRAWGTRIAGTPYIEHNDKHYLECIFNHAGKTKYLVDGVETAADEIEGLDIEKKVSDKEDTSQGGVEEKVIIRTYSIDSITTIRFKGEHS